MVPQFSLSVRFSRFGQFL